MLDFIEDKEVDMTVVKAALNGIYFSPSSMRKRPEKAKKKELFNLLIEYYLTLTNDKCKKQFYLGFQYEFFYLEMDRAYLMYRYSRYRNFVLML